MELMFSWVGQRVKYWWWRVKVYRNDKFKVTFDKGVTWKLGDVAVTSDFLYILYIGKGYWIYTKYAELNLK